MRRVRWRPGDTDSSPEGGTMGAMRHTPQSSGEDVTEHPNGAVPEPEETADAEQTRDPEPDSLADGLRAEQIADAERSELDGLEVDDEDEMVAQARSMSRGAGAAGNVAPARSIPAEVSGRPEVPAPGAEPAEEPATSEDELPDGRFADRELSWLAFNERVLEQAEDQDVPILERAWFLAIFASNLDEFYMVRVAGLKRRIATGMAVT